MRQPLEIPQVGEGVEVPTEISTYGKSGGMTLDAAIEQLVNENLDLLAAKLEVPMSEADVLTANLRANPDLLRRYSAHSVRPFLVPQAGWSAAK